MAHFPARVTRVFLTLLVVGAPLTVTIAFENAAQTPRPAARPSAPVAAPADAAGGGADATRAIERAK